MNLNIHIQYEFWIEFQGSGFHRAPVKRILKSCEKWNEIEFFFKDYFNKLCRKKW